MTGNAWGLTAPLADERETTMHLHEDAGEAWIDGAELSEDRGEIHIHGFPADNPEAKREYEAAAKDFCIDK